MRKNKKNEVDDESAAFVSISVFKFLWDKDHYIFYIRAISADGKDKAVSYRRYREFEELHHRLHALLEKNTN